MIGVGLMIYCYFFGPTGMRRQRAPFRELAGAFKDASLPLMIPVILLGGILTGWFTPTEAGVVAVEQRPEQGGPCCHAQKMSSGQLHEGTPRVLAWRWSGAG